MALWSRLKGISDTTTFKNTLFSLEGMTTKLVPAGSMKPGSYIVIDGVPCRVVSSDTSKPGKHGSAKVRIAAMGLWDNRRREIVCPVSDNVETPIIEKRNAQVLSVSGNTANVMDSESYETFDLEIPEELQGKVSEGAVVLYWEVLGKRVMKQIRSGGE